MYIHSFFSGLGIFFSVICMLTTYDTEMDGKVYMFVSFVRVQIRCEHHYGLVLGPIISYNSRCLSRNRVIVNEGFRRFVRRNYIDWYGRFLLDMNCGFYLN